MRRSSSVRCERSGIGEATASARAAAVDEAVAVAGAEQEDVAVAVLVPKAAMNKATAAANNPIVPSSSYFWTQSLNIRFSFL